jgi:hypothetical protein
MQGHTPPAFKHTWYLGQSQDLKFQVGGWGAQIRLEEMLGEHFA